VTGSGQEFVRASLPGHWVVPPEQTIGTMLKIDYEMIEGKPALIQKAGIVLVDDKAASPVAINMIIGSPPPRRVRKFQRRPAICSNGRKAAPARGIAMIVRARRCGAGVTPMARPAASRTRRSARFAQALYDEAKSSGWFVISMKNDWKRIFAFEP
jgi:hypothetical protein